jgi:hypothetical protein
MFHRSWGLMMIQQNISFVERHNWVDETATDRKSNLVVMTQRGFKPSLANIAARVEIPNETTLTVTGN